MVAWMLAASFLASPGLGAGQAGIPYQTLINLYLRDCAAQRRRLSLEWKASA